MALDTEQVIVEEDLFDRDNFEAMQTGLNRGDKVRFCYDNWPAGPYEVRGFFEKIGRTLIRRRPFLNVAMEHQESSNRKHYFIRVNRFYTGKISSIGVIREIIIVREKY